MFISFALLLFLMRRFKITFAKISIFTKGTFSYLKFKMMIYCLNKWDLIPTKTQHGYVIPYIIGTKHYHMFVEDSKKLMKPIICSVVVDDDIVWTDEFRKFMGYNENINYQNLTPYKLGYTKINIKTVTGRSYSFDSHQHIKL